MKSDTDSRTRSAGFARLRGPLMRNVMRQAVSLR
jgi:hypothetical protein